MAIFYPSIAIAKAVMIYVNKKKQSTQITDNYLQKQIEVGDIVHKVSNKTISKFRGREGKVIEVKGNRSKVIWDKRTTPEYEFNDNLKIIRMGKEIKTKEKKYAVMIIGKQTPSVTYNTYEEAEVEAKRLVMREQKPAYVLKSVAHIDNGQPIVTKH